MEPAGGTDYGPFVRGFWARAAQREARNKERWAAVHLLARRLGAMLRQEFAVSEVWLFGSALDQDLFSHDSDLDLAVTGLAPERYWAALARLEEMSPDLPVDLVTLETAPDSLRQRVLSEGVPLGVDVRG